LQLQLQSRNDRQQCRTPLMFSIVMLTARSAQYVASHPLGATETYMLAAIPITYEALESALEWSSSGGPFENEALLCRETGKVFLKSMHGDFGVELPGDIEDGTAYIAVPHKKDLNLGRSLVIAFAEAEAPTHLHAIESFFRQRGAHAKFKGLLERTHLLERWYQYGGRRYKRGFGSLGRRQWVRCGASCR
jgi:hypothetical protein